MMSSEGFSEQDIRRVLSTTFGFESFKSLHQAQAVDAVLQDRKDVFVCFPTGGGKSLTFQLPALLLRGVTLVISPLLALIEDQVQQLLQLGVRVAALNSKTTAQERHDIESDLQSAEPTLKLLYITPESLQTSALNTLLESLYNRDLLPLLAVDEAHCISSWGHDFRPSFRKIGNVRKRFPRIIIMALTATAKDRVRDDVISALGMRTPTILSLTTFRSNLHLEVYFKDADARPEEAFRHHIEDMVKRYPRDAGIVYTLRREDCDTLASELSQSKVTAAAYHAGLPMKERAKLQQLWQDGVIQVIVATIAFGMGVNKSNVRFVVHWTLSKSLEGYYQEAGRAGRDGNKSFCRLYYSIRERDWLSELERKDRERKSLKALDGKPMAPASTGSINAVVSYAENMTCRHAAIAKYFGENIQGCKTACDVCCNPEAVRRMQTNVDRRRLQARSFKGRSVSLTFNPAEKRDVEDESVLNPLSRRQTENDKIALPEILQSRLNHNRKRPSQHIPSGCQLVNPKKTFEKSNLSIAGREETVAKFTVALENNRKALSFNQQMFNNANAIDPFQLEYFALQKSGTMSSYILRCHDILDIIASSTKKATPVTMADIDPNAKRKAAAKASASVVPSSSEPEVIFISDQPSTKTAKTLEDKRETAKKQRAKVSSPTPTARNAAPVMMFFDAVTQNTSSAPSPPKPDKPSTQKVERPPSPAATEGLNGSNASTSTADRTPVHTKPRAQARPEILPPTVATKDEISNVVRAHLKPFYKSGALSKDDFKRHARRLTHLVFEQKIPQSSIDDSVRQLVEDSNL